MAAPGTKLVYQYEEALRKHLTRIHRVRNFSDLAPEEQALFKSGNEKTVVVETLETIFYAQGGGQPFDTGCMMNADDTQKKQTFSVEAVRYGSEGWVLHFGHFSNNKQGIEAFKEGDMVEQYVDGARRDQNSRVHTAGHCIGLAVRRLVERTPDLNVTELKATHYPDASFVEFKGSIDGEYKDAIQSAASKYVSDAMPIELYWFIPEELKNNGVITAEGMPIVTGADGKVRVVDIVGAGAYPCGGTHVPDTSYIGEVVLRNVKRQKGNTKITYEITEKKG